LNNYSNYFSNFLIIKLNTYSIFKIGELFLSSKQDIMFPDKYFIKIDVRRKLKVFGLLIFQEFKSFFPVVFEINPQEVKSWHQVFQF